MLGQQLENLASEIQATDETVHEMEKFAAISEELGGPGALPEHQRVR